MSVQFEKFRSLHASGQLLIIPNAWDAKSAMILQGQGFPAVATSSAAVAESLGYGDGEQMRFDEYLFVIRHMLNVLQVPLSVDLEMGYGRTDEEILDNVKLLASMGVAGINIEDSHIDTAGRDLKDAQVFANTLAFVRRGLADAGLDLFVNVRCDTYLLGVENARQETDYRVRLYESAGADGIFLPCIREEGDIEAAVELAASPVNVMVWPGLPGVTRLKELGVRRLSMGTYLFTESYGMLDTSTKPYIAVEYVN